MCIGSFFFLCTLYIFLLLCRLSNTVESLNAIASFSTFAASVSIRHTPQWSSLGSAARGVFRAVREKLRCVRPTDKDVRPLQERKISLITEQSYQCDGKKPHCQRCISRGTQCPGYPDNYAFREVRPAPHASCQKLVVASDPTSSSVKPPSQRNPKKYPTPEATPPSHVSCPITNPTLSLEWQSICYFIHHHVLRVHRSPCRGALAFFPDLYEEYASGSKGKTVGGGSCLKHAILSVSSLALYNASHVGELYVNARSHYGHAMKDLSYVLQEGKQDVISGDEILGTVLFLLYFAVSPLPPFLLLRMPS